MAFLNLCCNRDTPEDEPSQTPRPQQNNQVKSKPQSQSAPVPKPEDTTVILNGAAIITPPAAPPSLAEKIWDRAYNNLRDGGEKESKLVREYEKILSRQLKDDDDESGTPSASLEAVENAIEQHNPDKRRAQMRGIIDAGLKKTQKQANAKSVMGSILGGITPLTDIITAAISASPQAALPWAVVTTTLKLLDNPIAESAAQRTGAAYVTKRMSWYWNLSGVLLKKDNTLAGSPAEGMRDMLEADLVELYQQLLLFQMKTALACYGNQTLNFLKDLIKGSDWQGSLTDIQNAEKTFRENSQVYDTQKITASFDKFLKLQETRLRGTFRQDKKELLDWITTIDYGPRQSDHFEKRSEGTGLWLMESDEFKTWQRGNGKALMYHGIPGAGKTILTSVVVEEMSTKYYTDDTVGIAYLYCQFDQQDLRPIDLFLSLLKQLTEGLRFIPTHLEELHDRRSGNERPTFADVLKALQSTISEYSRVFIFIDALDECPVTNGNRRDFLLSELLPKLFSLQTECGANIFATSREVPEIIEMFYREACTTLPIRASDDDIRIFLDSHMKSLHPLVLARPALQEQVKNRIVEAAQGMFLLAKLHLDSLKGLSSPKKITTALDKLAAGLKQLDDVYEGALKRIESQTTDDQALAKKALAWITLSRRQLTPSELDHAAAVETGSTEFDKDNLSGIAYISSVCAGLVTIDESSNQVRLVHYTTYDFLIRSLPSWHPSGNKEVARDCVTYLSFDTIVTESAETSGGSKRSPQPDGLYQYAARNWGYHARTSPIDGEDAVVDFLAAVSKVSACIPFMQGITAPAEVSDIEKTTGIHVAAYWGLTESLRSLYERLKNDPELEAEAILEAPDVTDRTPLILAAENGQADMVKLLIDMGVDKEAKDSDDRTALYAAAENGHENVVKVLVELGANKEGSGDYTPLGVAVAEGHWAVAKLLLDNGVNPEGMSGEYCKSALLSASSSGNADMVKQLLDKGADINAVEADYGWTALTRAAEDGDEAVAKVLLGYDGLNMEAYDDYNHGTALFIAVANGREAVAKLLLENGADWQAKNEDDDTLLDIASRNGNEEMAKRLLEKYAKPYKYLGH
ncbi:Receptor-interacting serine/threonine-protein kinase 4 [Talaromyces islandicus]|uniref:Receptor-interacting serine/threonine-protein kinase 4 n=1 Tax=Talaromyces islandicus TaxID=28573 RepID=A0A0U1LLC7_TALIS|nr:Receptor-interacting serine/threonine-protein kinase 4 [Talaromyces islandicus]